MLANSTVVEGGPPIADGERLGSRRRLGLALGWAAVTCLALMPAIMAVAHRSTLLTLTLAAFFALAAVLVERTFGAFWIALAAALRRPVAIAAMAFLAWALASVAWSPSPLQSLRAWGEFVLPIGGGLVLALILPRQMGRRAASLLATGVALGALIILADLATGMVYRGMLGMRVAAFVLNRPSLTLLALLPVSAWLLWRDGWRILPAVLCLLVAAAILRSESGAAKLGLAVLAVTAPLAWFSRRVVPAVLAAILLATLAFSPKLGDLADRFLPPQLYAALARAHAQDRVDIWRSFDAVLPDRPLAGWGFGTSAHMPAPAGFPTDFTTLLAVGHPHNAALQIWVELGAVGCCLAAALLILLVAQLSRLPDAPRAIAFGLMAAAFAVSLVGQGAWQGWWPAALAAMAVWLSYGRVRLKRD